jgi:hypothetical protein
MATKQNFQLGVPLPFYPGENVTGAYLTLSQSPCNNPWRKGLCCALPRESARKEAREPREPVCANWTGAHTRHAAVGARTAAATQAVYALRSVPTTCSQLADTLYACAPRARQARTSSAAAASSTAR